MEEKGRSKKKGRVGYVGGEEKKGKKKEREKKCVHGWWGKKKKKEIYKRIERGGKWEMKVFWEL